MILSENILYRLVLFATFKAPLKFIYMFMLRDQNCGWIRCTYKQLAANWVTIKRYITKTTQTDVGHFSTLLVSGSNILERLQLIN